MRVIIFFIGIFIFVSCSHSKEEGLEYYENGKKLYNKKKLEKAYSIFEKAYNSDPSLLNAILMQSKIRYYQKKFNAALTLQNRLLSKNSEHVGALYWKSRTVVVSNNKDSHLAIKILLKVLEVDSHHIPARALLALLYEKKGKYNRAITEYKRIFLEQEGIINSKINLALLYNRLGLKEKSKEEIIMAETLSENAKIKNSNIILIKKEIER